MGTYKPNSLKECIEILEKKVSLEQKEHILAYQSCNEFSLEAHFSFGFNLRNTFSMWDMDSPLVLKTGMSGDKLSSTVLKCFYYHLKRKSRKDIYDPYVELKKYKENKSSNVDPIELAYILMIHS